MCAPSADVVRKLLNAYMVQFLETGFLHADPHPGNFLIQPDGRLCIMDYGMMTEILPDQVGPRPARSLHSLPEEASPERNSLQTPLHSSSEGRKFLHRLSHTTANTFSL